MSENTDEAGPGRRKEPCRTASRTSSGPGYGRASSIWDCRCRRSTGPRRRRRGFPAFRRMRTTRLQWTETISIWKCAPGTAISLRPRELGTIVEPKKAGSSDYFGVRWLDTAWPFLLHAGRLCSLPERKGHSGVVPPHSKVVDECSCFLGGRPIDLGVSLG